MRSLFQFLWGFLIRANRRSRVFLVATALTWIRVPGTGRASPSDMTWPWARLFEEEDGHAVLGYALVTGLFSVLVFQPELAAAVVYQLADLFNLFLSQVQAVF